MHCHHEKLVIVDGEVAFVGGIDLTSLGGDRFDTSDHLMRGRLGWHDASSCVRGPAVGDVAAHFAARWRDVPGEFVEGTAPPAAAGEVELQVVRTVPDKVYDFLPHGDFRIVEFLRYRVGSANLNEHSFFNDTEMNVVTCDPRIARETRLRLWAEHLERSVEDVSGEPAQVIDELWRPIAGEQLERRRRGEPLTHRLQELPGVSKRAMALLGPLHGLLVDG
jgi:phosphatidylserine/phosphatidylglycerophosphate/cardiolipin synthase-like enzyme